ncbi:hypothetical protein CXB51_036080 [Gossypium anomalum]|uniref:DUF7745 domain-containing protein n=1 Tax=Gossypium anomalum TaxID=47600 RepID=A0A8J5XV96_9ROSI|nr:hypothetical protein CXB51_036080 [Gossypium anomalum]
MEGCVSNLPEGIFTERYGDIANLIAINVDERLIQAMVKFWDLAYQCFTFNQEDMTPTIEEYAALLRIDNVQLYKIYVKEPKPMTFKKKLMRLTDMTDIWAEKQIKKKNETSCIPWFSLRRLVLNYPDMLKRVNLFALAIYGLIVFPKVLGHIEVAVVDFFEKLKQGINLVPTILAETFRSLSICRRKGKGRFIGCAQLLNNLRAEDVTWRAPWMRPSFCYTRWETKIGCHCLDYGEELSEFAFAGEGYIRRVRDIAKSWKRIHLMELAMYADTLTQDYVIWRKQRVNSQHVSSTNYTVQNLFSAEVSSELEMARQEFEREKDKMSRDLSALQEENYQLKIDVQIERSRTEKVQKEVEVVRNDLRDLYLENKKLRVTTKNSRLGKSSAEWKEELSSIKGGMEFWKGKAKKEEEKASRAMIELRKKNAEYETMSAEVMTSRSNRQELKERIRDLEDMLQDRQQQLDTLLKTLEEKNSQYNRDIRAYKEGLQEKEMQLTYLINEIHGVAMHVVQLSEEAEILICQFPPSRR